MNAETEKMLDTMSRITNSLILLDTNVKLLMKKTDEIDKRLKFLEGVEEEEREFEENKKDIVDDKEDEDEEEDEEEE